MHFNVRCSVEWGDTNHPYGSYETTLGVRGVSREHVLNKAIKAIEAWPCYADRLNGGIYVRAEAKLLENKDERKDA